MAKDIPTNGKDPIKMLEMIFTAIQKGGKNPLIRMRLVLEALEYNATTPAKAAADVMASIDISSINRN